MTAVGNLEVGGRYEAYGQKLRIERGHLVWSNDPVSDPILDIRAVRKIEARGITAGIDVTGRASAPPAEAWTDPATNRSDALSSPALGRPPSKLSSAERHTPNTAPPAPNARAHLPATQHRS